MIAAAGVNPLPQRCKAFAQDCIMQEAKWAASLFAIGSGRMPIPKAPLEHAGQRQSPTGIDELAKLIQNVTRKL